VTRKFLIPMAAILVAIPLAFAACGDDDDEETTAASEETIEATTGGGYSGGGGGGETAGGGGETVAISETEFALDPADATVAAGPLTIEVTNDGGTTHNLEVEGDGVEEITSDLAPGDSEALELDLPAGSYEMYCAIGTHKDQGMEGTLTVE
jgi:plastocyanin